MATDLSRRRGFLCFFWVSLTVLSTILWNNGIEEQRNRVADHADVFIFGGSKPGAGPPSSWNHPQHSSSVSHAEQTSPSSSSSSYLIPVAPDASCEDIVHSAIRGVVPLSESRFARCPVTSQVRISFTGSTDHNMQQQWMLYSLDKNGIPKTVGGDEYYIVYTDDNMVPDKITNVTHATAVAIVEDNDDGTYSLTWKASPMLDKKKSNSLAGTGKLHVHFEYTCGVGRMGQPMKDHWNCGGATHTDYVLHNVVMPTFAPFERPSPPVNLKEFDVVVGLGDSVMGNFIGREDGWFGKTNIVACPNPASALNTETVQDWLTLLRYNFSDTLLTHDQSVAVLTGSSTWDLLRNDVDQWMTWKDHLKAVRTLITTIRTEYPRVKVLWKSATVLHICNVELEALAKESKEWGVDRLRYMSRSRTYDIYQAQQQLMHELSVPVLDVYELTLLAGDYPRRLGDGRHYTNGLNRMMLEWFYY